MLKRTKRDLPLMVMIPDLQNKAGVPLNHVEWIGKYIREKRPTNVINIGDHFDMAGLSFYDRGKLDFEGRRVETDLLAGEYANQLLLTPVWDMDKSVRPILDFFKGNHEYRLERFIQEHPELSGVLSDDLFNLDAWYDRVHEFLVPITINGVAFAHYFANPNTGKPWGGMIETRIKNVGRSFAMGHQQGLKWGQLERPMNGQIDYGLIAGSAYLHYEKYKGPQSNDHWRGIILMYNAQDGMYDLSTVSLDSLCRRYEGMPLSDFMNKPDRHIGV